MNHWKEERPSAPTPAEARALQERLRHRVIIRDIFGAVGSVAGVDVGFEQGGAITRAAVAVLAFPGLEPVEQAVARRETDFPYIPGLLSFREIPAIVDAVEQLGALPDMLLCDGQGIAHPRRFGIASHLGLLLDRPSIGVAKSRLVGSHGEIPQKKGGWTPLMDGDEIIGAVLRTREGVRPLYISVGHRVSLDTAIAMVMNCITRYRLPETTRRAHRLASG
uniref:Endonuclease V n=1 Tax=Candidatus Kentrum sp. DK TaxID=2126562 RepID=A0A450RU02_9GAMM|nr:MAG: Endonuclease V [Candidatus Kentron sp. DK]VFJ52788.1 MAG: Endonuclease V [Candidatus Kentron sp. DK]